MSRIDLSKLRKRAGMSQRELASLLQVRPSFLSAIENGRSRLPEEKQEKIKEIFALDSLEEYMIDDLADVVVPPHTHVPPHSHDGDASIPPHIHTSPSTQSDAITQLLNHFHDLAHQRDRQHTSADEETAARIDLLEKRNDRLSERVDNLREEIDSLREENLRLKEIILKNGLTY